MNVNTRSPFTGHLPSCAVYSTLDESDCICTEAVERCPVCGEPIDYCQGHGAIGDERGHAVLNLHDAEIHAACTPLACTLSNRHREVYASEQVQVDNLVTLTVMALDTFEHKMRGDYVLGVTAMLAKVVNVPAYDDHLLAMLTDWNDVQPEREVY